MYNKNRPRFNKPDEVNKIMQKIKSFFTPKKEKNAQGKLSYYLTYGDKILLNDYSSPELALEGYCRNIIGYKCISLIGLHVSMMNYKLVQVDDDGTTIKDVVRNHPVLKLLRKPYPQMTKESFLNRVASQGAIYGNYYIEKRYNNRGGNPQMIPPIYLFPLRPDWINTMEGQNSIASSYTYNSDFDGSITFNVGKLGASNLIHGMNFNPKSDYHGISPLLAAGYSIDLHNDISKEDLKLVQNGVRPSGILTVPAGVNFDAKQIDKIKSDLKEKYEGAENKGKPLVLNNGMTWQQVSINPADSELNEKKKQAAQEIGLAYNVPMELLNQTAAKFDNMDAAYLQFYQDAVIPRAKNIVSELNDGLLPLYKDSENLMLLPDFSHTQVMKNLRMQTMEKLNPITFISNNEKRQMVDMEPMDGQDELKEPVKMNPEKNEYIAEQLKDGLTYKEAEEQAHLIYG